MLSIQFKQSVCASYTDLRIGSILSISLPQWTVWIRIRIQGAKQMQIRKVRIRIRICRHIKVEFLSFLLSLTQVLGSLTDLDRSVKVLKS
jgi:hypothetical protein